MQIMTIYKIRTANREYLFTINSNSNVKLEGHLKGLGFMLFLESQVSEVQYAFIQPIKKIFILTLLEIVKEILIKQNC